MVYKWRPRPAWLKAVLVNKDPVPTPPRRPALKTYWGTEQTLSWSDLLAMADLSRGEDHFIFPDRDAKRQWQIDRFAKHTLRWRDLPRDLQPDASYVQTIQWKDIVNDEKIALPKDGLNSPLTWIELLATLDR